MSSRKNELVVVAGEPSGDRIAAEVLGALERDDVRAYGIGGRACRRRGLTTFADVSELGAMGTIDVLAGLSALGRALVTLAERVTKAAPKAALLVNFTELNARLGRLLRRRGVRVLWIVAPQVWAWRAARIHALHEAVDKLAVILPFEEPLWRGAGYDATFIGHPSFEVKRFERAEARKRLDLGADRRAVVVLPGSRTGEIFRLASVLCEAAAALVASGDVDEARALAAPWLAPRARQELEKVASRAGIAVFEADEDRGASPLLGAFDLALSASGTACLEATLAGLPTVVGYRVDPLTFAVASRLVRTPHIALPNVLLGRRAFSELLQGDATAASFTRKARAALEPDATARARLDILELRSKLEPPGPGTFGERAADLLRPWLDR